MRPIKKAFSIWKERGLSSLIYLTGEKLKNRLPEQQKYNAYIRNEKRRRRQNRTDWCKTAGTLPKICLLELGDDIFSSIEEADAPYVAFLEPGDQLCSGWEKLVGAYLLENPGCRFLYTDEDKVIKGRRRDPVFKPDWSPDTYLSYDYVGGLLVLEQALAAEAKEQIHARYRESFLYELGLRASAMISPKEIGHLDQVICHRNSVTTVPKQQAIQLKKTLLAERGIQGQVCWTEAGGTAQIIYENRKEPLVSIIVPTKDQPSLLASCIRSVERGTRYPRAEWIIVDNGSASGNKKIYEKICEESAFPCRYLYEPMEFNFSRMCNRGARAANGEFLLFLNDDMELPAHESDREPDWLSRLVGQASLAHTGAVGAKLLYPGSSLIQHLGVVNYTSGPAHLLWQKEDSGLLPFLRNVTTQNYAIVTGACLTIKADRFWQVGGFEERLAVTFNDVELCIRLLKAGYYQTVRSDVVLYHHESLSRGQDALDEKKFLRGLKERELLYDLHPDLIGIDPFYSRHLTQKRLDHTLDYPVKWKLSKKIKAVPAKTGTHLVWRILRITWQPELCVEGWAYWKGADSLPVTVVFEKNGGETAFLAEMRYSPTIATEQGRKERLDFSEFFCRIPKDALESGRYEIGLQIRDERCPAGEIQIP